MTSKIKFRPTDFIRNLDPRAQLLFYISYIAIVLIQNMFKPQILIALIAVILILMLFSGYPLTFYIKRLLAVYPMIFFVSLLLPFTATTKSSEVLISIFGLKIYHSGLSSFIFVNIKMLLIFASSLLLSRICGTFRLLKSLESLKLPLWIISILLYMRHLFYLLSAEQKRIQTAFSARYRYLPLFTRINVLRGIVIIYLTRTMERSDRIYMAMSGKGFSGKLPNSVKTNWKISDSLFCGGLIIYFGLVLYVF